MQKKYLYIVLTMTDTFIARGIRFLTGKPYSHSSLACDEDLTQMYSFCRDKKETPLPASFNHENINTQVFGLYDNVPCEIYRLAVTDEQHRKFIETMKHFISNKALYTYNLKGFFLMALHIPTSSRYKFVCSVWVAFVLGKTGIDHNFKKHSSLIEPEDLRHIEDAELFYKGNLKEYPDFLKNLRSEESDTDARKAISLIKNPHKIINSAAL